MRRSKAEIYLHFVWATVQRLPLITADIERELYGSITAESIRCGAEVFAIGGIENHVHLVVKKPPTISESQLMQRIKGISSTQVRQQIAAPGTLFRWQENYGVFSFHKDQLDKVVTYVLNQKQHHAEHHLRENWEAEDEEGPAPQPAPNTGR